MLNFWFFIICNFLCLVEEEEEKVLEKEPKENLLEVALEKEFLQEEVLEENP